jgi:hypothetical protein
MTPRTCTPVHAVVLAAVASLAAAARAPAANARIPEDARYACPMETHPDEQDPARRGAFFSANAGRCDWCGMQLKPLDELPWVQARRWAGDAAVAYTCSGHQHVFSWTAGDCPRCERKLEPFKVMYTCPDPAHARQISVRPDDCPECGRRFAPFRGVWLAPTMAERNVPPRPEAAAGAAYRCATHPLANSDRPGRCPVCAAELVAAAADEEPVRLVPADAQYVCPMEKCDHFAPAPGRCPVCGMRIRPVEGVAWARARVGRTRAAAAAPFVCPMHPDERAAARGACGVCGMQLVPAAALPRPATAPEAVATQVDFLMEHYLALHERFASDSTREVALHALGLVGAADEVLKHADSDAAGLSAEFFDAVRALRAAALRTDGRDLAADRLTFVGLSGSLVRIVAFVRPSQDKFPALHLFHCPMTKGDWVQATEELANPFYGFAMLKCGERTGTR